MQKSVKRSTNGSKKKLVVYVKKKRRGGYEIVRKFYV